MNSSIQIARIMGIPIVVNLSWFITLAFVTILLALNIYPAIIPDDSPYRNDYALHWIMALGSGIAFFVSIVLHELAHSFVALRQGIQVRNITLFIFGGVSQIAGEARKPLEEFIMAIVGPLTSALLGGLFFLAWLAIGMGEDGPVEIVLQWLFVMNLVLAIFNMAPAFPMDGGRVFRAVIWGISGNLIRSTRLATLLSRGLGYGLVAVGALTVSQIWDFFEPLNGVWFIILGLFLESSAKQSWLQARALDILGKFRARDLMSTEMPTVPDHIEVRFLQMRANRHFTLFVTNEHGDVVGLVTEREVMKPGLSPNTPASEIMIKAAEADVANESEDGASLFQRMETASVWQLPVVAEGRLLGVVSRETLIRLFTTSMQTQTGLAGPR